MLDVAKFSAPPDAVDKAVLDRCPGPTLDLGCGPGRLVAELAGRGVPALGVDVAPFALLLSRANGATALRRSIFDRLPGAGRWPHALLMDGNIGIGGDPGALLERLRTLIRPRVGELIVETEAEDVDVRYRVRFGFAGVGRRWFRSTPGSCTGGRPGVQEPTPRRIRLGPHRIRSAARAGEPARLRRAPGVDCRRPPLRRARITWGSFPVRISVADVTSPQSCSPAAISGTPLPKKFGIKAGHHVLFHDAPEGFDPQPLPYDVTVETTEDGGAGPYDVIVRVRQGPMRRSPTVTRASRRLLAKSGALWMCWPKKASGIVTDVTESAVREDALALPIGLVDVKIAAVDATWSGLKLVYRLDRR